MLEQYREVSPFPSTNTIGTYHSSPSILSIKFSRPRIHINLLHLLLRRLQPLPLLLPRLAQESLEIIVILVYAIGR